MLNIGSLVTINDTTEAKSIKILNIKKKKNVFKAKAKVSDIIFGVICDHDPNKKKILLKKKDKAVAIIVCVKKKYSKKNGIYIRFSQNVCIPLKITRFINPVAKHIFTPVFYEIVFFKKYKLLNKNIPKFL